MPALPPPAPKLPLRALDTRRRAKLRRELGPIPAPPSPSARPRPGHPKPPGAVRALAAPPRPAAPSPCPPPTCAPRPSSVCPASPARCSPKLRRGGDDDAGAPPSLPFPPPSRGGNGRPAPLPPPPAGPSRTPPAPSPPPRGRPERGLGAPQLYLVLVEQRQPLSQGLGGNVEASPASPSAPVPLTVPAPVTGHRDGAGLAREASRSHRLFWGLGAHHLLLSTIRHAAPQAVGPPWLLQRVLGDGKGAPPGQEVPSVPGRWGRLCCFSEAAPSKRKL